MTTNQPIRLQTDYLKFLALLFEKFCRLFHVSNFILDSKSPNWTSASRLWACKAKIASRAMPLLSCRELFICINLDLANRHLIEFSKLPSSAIRVLSKTEKTTSRYYFLVEKTRRLGKQNPLYGKIKLATLTLFSNRSIICLITI